MLVLLYTVVPPSMSHGTLLVLRGLQFHDIEKIAEHPVPWPYTHLTQFFLVIWVYSLPLCLVPTYGFAGMSGVFEATVVSLLSAASLPMRARLRA